MSPPQHNNYHVRIGISEDRGIIYKDLNGNYNVAGNGINMASRVMGFADRSQILFTSEAFRQVVDMVDDPKLVDRFIEYPNIEVKHGVKLNIYQYIGESEDFLNSSAPKDLESIKRIENARIQLRSAGLPMFSSDELANVDKEAMIGFMENFANLVTTKKDKSTIIVNPVIDQE